jgi:hypothetical protein
MKCVSCSPLHLRKEDVKAYLARITHRNGRQTCVFLKDAAFLDITPCASCEDRLITLMMEPTRSSETLVQLLLTLFLVR